MAGTRFQQPITIGAAVTALASLAATVMLYVNGQVQVTREVNYIQVGTSTGAVQQVDGVTQKKIVPFACTFGAGGTASGGLANYDFCRAAAPFTTTGAITAVGLECGNVPRPFSLSGSFVLGSHVAINDPLFPNLRAYNVGTGAKVYFSTGYTLWNPTKNLKFSALTSVSQGWNTGNNCKGFYEARDKYGN